MAEIYDVAIKEGQERNEALLALWAKDKGYKVNADKSVTFEIRSKGGDIIRVNVFASRRGFDMHAWGENGGSDFLLDNFDVFERKVNELEEDDWSKFY